MIFEPRKACFKYGSMIGGLKENKNEIMLSREVQHYR